MQKHTIQFAVQSKNGVIEKVGKSTILQPKTNFKGGEIRYLTDFKLLHDISLHMNINNSEITYLVAIIIWAEDENGKEIHVEFYDPFNVEINAEDNKYLKKLVMNKLMEAFF